MVVSASPWVECGCVRASSDDATRFTEKNRLRERSRGRGEHSFYVAEVWFEDRGVTVPPKETFRDFGLYLQDVLHELNRRLMLALDAMMGHDDRFTHRSCARKMPPLIICRGTVPILYLEPDAEGYRISPIGRPPYLACPRCDPLRSIETEPFAEEPLDGTDTHDQRSRLTAPVKDTAGPRAKTGRKRADRKITITTKVTKTTTKKIEPVRRRRRTDR